MTEKKIAYKYAEDRILADLKAMIDSTYSEHYASSEPTEHQLQAFDAWIALGDATPTFRNTALKYLWRYGKKDGNNKKDLMKALHYVILCLYNDHYKGMAQSEGKLTIDPSVIHTTTLPFVPWSEAVATSPNTMLFGKSPADHR